MEKTLNLVNEGKFEEAVKNMDRFIHVTVKNKKTHKNMIIKSNGLISRRINETKPFRSIKPLEGKK